MSQIPPSDDNPFASDTNPYASPEQKPGVQQPIRQGAVKNYLVEAILCLLCCGGLFAIPAIVYAAQVNPKLSVGDYEGAVQASENAKKWCIIAVCIGVVCGGLSVVIQMGAMG